MQVPFFSVVIANFNHGAFLEDAIASMLRQSCQDFELIVVDGGSRDNSVDVIKKYSNSIAWWCSEKDGGQSEAFNKGFSHAKGVFGCWLNADDIMMPQTLENVKAYIVSHPRVEWLCGGSVFCDSDMRVMWCSRCLPNIPVLQRFFPVLSVNGPSSFFKLSRLQEVTGFNTQLHYVMDIDLWVRFSKAGMTLCYLQKYLWGFRIHANSKTSHRFVTKVSKPEFRDEGRGMLQGYGVTVTKKKLWEQISRGIKLFSLVYFMAFKDTRRWRGLPVLTIKNRA